MLRELERYYEDYCESIRQEAEKLRAEEMPEPTEDLFAIYENTGNRLIYEDVYFERRKFLAVFGLKAILDGEERDIQKLEDILEGICAEECWALPAHVNRMTDENWRTYVDLFAAETAQTLAEIASLLGGRLSQETVRTVEQEVMRRVDAVAKETGATIEITNDEGTLTGADVIYGDIWASMGEEALIPERAKLLTPYRVTEQTLERTGNRNVLYLHCLPSFHDFETKLAKEWQAKGVDIREVTDEVFRGRHSVVFDEAENRLHAQKAVMYLLMKEKDQ